ncbi:2-keto-3-deoxy-galactonokinase [Gemmobacter lutimaris]|uniref:2-keto-3-deoxy-galactonokinase n=1 Tax=Gemmobacter lutimaris TaxID=2306023 RepID=A0A398BS67_9RHOB|nr:2-dehydro-3-deoxygalactonokinase [Gemmobacter lutimaris]RID90770.1 2-keto-3-deoxy-galactonokinase [Gemmobacter lutimaris]
MTPDWIAADCTANHLRLWAMGPDGVLARAEAPAGAEPLVTLQRLAAQWLAEGRQVEVIASGLAPVTALRAVPCTPVATALPATMVDPRLSLRLVPGLRQDRPADLTQGAEVRIAGALRVLGDFDGVICLPGRTTVWAHLSAGEVVSFQSFVTGHLLATLAGVSTLPPDSTAFTEALTLSRSRPERLASQIASLQAEALLSGLDARTLRSRRSGLLLGAELTAARPYWLGQRVVLVGADPESHRIALAAEGVPAQILPEEACILAGLALLHRAG